MDVTGRAEGRLEKIHGLTSAATKDERWTYDHGYKILHDRHMYRLVLMTTTCNHLG